MYAVDAFDMGGDGQCNLPAFLVADVVIGQKLGVAADGLRVGCLSRGLRRRSGCPRWPVSWRARAGAPGPYGW
jgi:hypothetical protein